MSRSFLEILTVGVGVTIALLLFAFGLNYPLQSRVNGDALEYLRIADSLSNLDTIASYAGTRTIGFPLFERGVYQIVALFGEPVFVLRWVNSVGLTMLTMHIVATWLFSRWTQTSGVIRQDRTRRIVFLMLATFPALIGHTTTPLTDTFTVDLVLIGLLFYNGSLRATTARWSVLWALSGGVILGFATLVRPGSSFGLAIALLVCFFVSLRSQATRQLASACILAGFFVTLLPSTINCSNKYGSVCLQSPKTFDSALHIQSGLRGARVLWRQSDRLPDPIPVLTDELMYESFYKQCRIDSVIGADKNSFTGCLLATPHAVPFFLLKKWIGLFDYFRFTPYLEARTPNWLQLLSRFYGMVAWIGLCFSLVLLCRFALIRKKIEASNSHYLNLDLIFISTYSLIMLAQHTVLHPEERFGFPLIPMCVVVFFVMADKFLSERHRVQSFELYFFVLYGCMASGVFAWQVKAWDHASLALG